MKAVRTALLLVLAVSLAAGVSGCSMIAEKTAERLTEEAIEGETGNQVDITKDGVTVEGEDGSSASVGESVEVPEDFPKDVPVYDGKLTGAFTSDDTFTLTLETPDSAADVVDFYAKELKDEGWTQESTMNTADGGMFSGKKGQRTVAIVANSDSGTDDATVVTISTMAE